MKRPLPDISDQKLVVLLKRDDLKSYEVLFHRYYDLFLTFTKRVVREHVAAEDIVQEVFMYSGSAATGSTSTARSTICSSR